MLEWLKTVLGDAYTPEIDTAVSQEIGKGFVARTDFNTKTAKVTELETEVKQLREGTMVWKRLAAGKESAPPFTTATRTHHMSVAATRT